MESSLKIALGIVAAALLIGLLGMPAIAQTGFRGSGMMGGGMGGMMGSGLGGSGMMGAGMMGNARGMLGTAGFGGMMGSAGYGTCGMHESGSDASSGGCGMMDGVDMNQMHKAMHGDSDYDMNAMHARMLAGNLTQADWDEMREHCPMMRNWNQTKQ